MNSPRPGWRRAADALFARRAARERVVRGSEARQRALMTATSQLLWTADTDGLIHDFQPQWSAYTGQDLAAMRGEGWLEAIHPADRGAVSQAWAAAQQGQAPYEIQMRIRRHDGVYRWFVTRGVPWYDPEGRLQAWIGTCRDIEEQVRAQQALEANLRHIEGLNAISRSLGATMDLAEMIRQVVGQVLELFGADRAWLLCPCDPEAATMRVPFEVARPEWPGAFATGAVMPLDDNAREVMRQALASREPIALSEGPDAPAVWEAFGVRAEMHVAIRPRLGEAWLLGLHQCSYPRVWQEAERELLGDVALRMGDAFSNLRYHEELRASEARYRSVVDTVREVLLRGDEEGRLTFSTRPGPS